MKMSYILKAERGVGRTDSATLAQVRRWVPVSSWFVATTPAMMAEAVQVQRSHTSAAFSRKKLFSGARLVRLELSILGFLAATPYQRPCAWPALRGLFDPVRFVLSQTYAAAGHALDGGGGELP